jgi:hypothetical protein
MPVIRTLTAPTATLEQTYLLPSRLLSPHTRYYVREMRILAYSQLLESYRSVTLESISGAFGVSVDFIDRQVHLTCSMLLTHVLNIHSASSHDLSPTAAYTALSTRCMASWKRRDHR